MSIPSTDVVVVGAGACGSLVAKELAAHGFSVVVLEAGKRYDPARDLANSETNAGRIMWAEPRVLAVRAGVVPKVAVGVGGGTLPWRGVMLRFRSSAFRSRPAGGFGAEWPVGY